MGDRDEDEEQTVKEGDIISVRFDPLMNKNMCGWERDVVVFQKYCQIQRLLCYGESGDMVVKYGCNSSIELLGLEDLLRLPCPPDTH